MFLISVVPVVAPRFSVVAAPAILTVVALPLRRLDVPDGVIILPVTVMLPLKVALSETLSVLPSVVAPLLTFSVPVFWMSIPRPFLS